MIVFFPPVTITHWQPKIDGKKKRSNSKTRFSCGRSLQVYGLVIQTLLICKICGQPYVHVMGDEGNWSTASSQLWTNIILLPNYLERLDSEDFPIDTSNCSRILHHPTDWGLITLSDSRISKTRDNSKTVVKFLCV